MLSEAAEKGVVEKLEEVVDDNGGTLGGLKCDDVFAALYPDRVDLHDFRNVWQRIHTAEKLEDEEVAENEAAKS